MEEDADGVFGLVEAFGDFGAGEADEVDQGDDFALFLAELVEGGFDPLDLVVDRGAVAGTREAGVAGEDEGVGGAGLVGLGGGLGGAFGGGVVLDAVGDLSQGGGEEPAAEGGVAREAEALLVGEDLAAGGLHEVRSGLLGPEGGAGPEADEGA